MSPQRFLAWASSAVVAVSIVAGLLILGTPEAARERRLDDRRVSDLQQLATAIRSAHRRDGALPAGLAELVDGVALLRLPADPRSGAPYAYRIETPERFVLCAHFDRASEEPDSGFWAHGAGERCFAFDVATDPRELPLARPAPIQPDARVPPPGR